MLAKLLPLSFVSLVLLVACTTDDAALAEPRLGSVHPRILNGVASTDDQDATVMMIHLNGDRRNLCTAVMVAKNLVLTARHCVSDSDEVVGCNSDGTPLEGAGIRGNFLAQDLYFFTGKTRPAFTNFATNSVDPAQWKPVARGTQIIDDGSGTLCSHDIALVVLDTPLENVPIAPIRLTRDPELNEMTYTVGWGISTAELEPSVRQQRRDIPITRLGPNDSYPVLTRSEFLTGESICLGDSGGPIFSQRTNAVIGVVSRGGNGADYDPNNPGSTCIDADNFNTKLSPFQETINNAFRAAGASPVLEPAPEEDGCHVGAVGRPGHAEVGVFGLIFGLSALARRRAKRG